MDNISDWKNAIIVSPDAGGAKRYISSLFHPFLITGLNVKR
jgi:hypothetical protein